MGFLDDVKSRITKIVSDKLDEAFGEGEVVKKEDVQNLVTQETPFELDIDAINNQMCEASKVGTNGFEEVTGEYKEDELYVPEEQDCVTVDVRPVAEVDFSETPNDKVLEEQCNCKLFRRAIKHDELYVLRDLNKHVRITKDNIDEVVSLALMCASMEVGKEKYVFVAMNTDVIYNFVYYGNTANDIETMEFRYYLQKRVEQLGVYALFYVQSTAVECIDVNLCSDLHSILWFDNTTVNYYFTFHQTQVEVFKRKGKTLDCREDNNLSYLDIQDTEMIEYLEQDMRDSLYPGTQRYFILSDEFTVCLNVCNYIQVVTEVAEKLEYIIRGFKNKET